MQHARPTEPENEYTFIYPRFRALMNLRSMPIETLAQEVSVSCRHLWCVLKNERRGSSRLMERLQHVLGDPGWRFITGQTNAVEDADRSAGADR